MQTSNKFLWALGVLALIALCNWPVLAGAQIAKPETIISQNVPAIGPDIAEKLVPYRNIRQARFLGFAKNGLIVSTRFGETWQLHQVGAPLAARRQLTFAQEPVRTTTISPGGDALIYTRDTGGDELYQGYILSLTTGDETAISEPGSRNGDFVWSRDGSKIAWYTTTSNSKNWAIRVADTSQPTDAKTIFEPGGAVFVQDWSADNQKLLVQQFISIKKSRLYIVDRQDGSAREIFPTDDDIAYDTVKFADKGRAIIATTDKNSEFFKLAKYDLNTKEWSDIVAAGWDIEGWDLSPDRSMIAYAQNVDGQSQIRFHNLNGRTRLKGPDLPPGIVTDLEFDQSGDRIGFTFNAAGSPADAWTFDLRRNRFAARTNSQPNRWTKSETGGLQSSRFVSPDLIRYQTFDNTDDGEPRTISAYVYKPNRPGPHPVIVSIHGGPERQYRPGFSSKFQYWVNELGVAVIAPNVRGSVGYGKSFTDLDNGWNRENAVKDIGALLDWIANEPGLDETRVVVHGISYGGYMVLASLVHYSDRLAAGVDIVGISNFVTFLENTKEYRRNLRRPEYGDERDPEMRAFLERISPSNNAERISKPLFIIQGQNDPRVPMTESEQMVAALKRNKTDVWYLLATDEGHGFRKKKNIDYQQAAETAFFNEFLELAK